MDPECFYHVSFWVCGVLYQGQFWSLKCGREKKIATVWEDKARWPFFSAPTPSPFHTTLSLSPGGHTNSQFRRSQDITPVRHGL